MKLTKEQKLVLNIMINHTMAKKYRKEAYKILTHKKTPSKYISDAVTDYFFGSGNIFCMAVDAATHYLHKKGYIKSNKKFGVTY